MMKFTYLSKRDLCDTLFANKARANPDVAPFGILLNDSMPNLLFLTSILLTNALAYFLKLWVM